MSTRWLQPREALPVPGGSEVVCLICDEANAQASLQSIVAHTDEHVPILLFGGDERELARLSEGAPGRAVSLLRRERSTLASLAAAAAPADIALVSRGAKVGPRWLERLAAAARSDTTVATATALADHGGALSVPVHDRRGADAIAQRALRNYPRIMRARIHCVFVRRRALQLLGEADAGVVDPEAELCEFSLRCLEHGMVHVVGDDVFVTCQPPREPAGVQGFEREDHEDERSGLRRAVRIAELAVSEPMTVTLDARALGPTVGGTQVYIAQLALALARSGRAAVRLVVAPADLAPELEPVLARERGLEVITYDAAVAGVPRTHVVHRPQQVFSEHDLALLRLLGERIVITHQDLIMYRIPSYHTSLDEWRTYRRVTRIALAVADKVVFFSQHARNDALAEGLIDARHTEVVGIGSDVLWRLPAQPRRPDGAPAEGEFLLCLGADYRHKNRPFAIRVARALRVAHGWPGKLVFAGAHVAHGSSRDEERALLAADPQLRDVVVDVGPVDEAGKGWLYEHAAAVLCPSLYEGFGLLPYEAAGAGIPCLFAPQTALVELGGAELASLIPWDAAASAAAAAPLLDNQAPDRARHIQQLRHAADASRWEGITPMILDAYEGAIRADHRAGAHYGWQELERERYIRDLAAWVEEYRAAVSGDAVMLVRPDGWLDEPTRRGLMRIASRPALRRPLLWPFALLGRMRKQ